MPTVDLTPLVDLLVATLVLEDGHEVCTPDEHFQRVPGLRLYEAKTALGVSLSRPRGQRVPLRAVLGVSEGGA